MNKTNDEINRLIIGCVTISGTDGCLPSKVRTELLQLRVDPAQTQACILALLRDKKLSVDKKYKLHVNSAK